MPGVVDAWEKLSQKFGRLPLSQCLAPSISLAGLFFSLSIETKKKQLSGSSLKITFQ